MKADRKGWLESRKDFKHRGISWELLAHIARYAEAKAGKTLESIESHENHAAIELEREMGFSAEPYPGDATLVLVRRKLTRWPMHSLEANHIGKSPGVHSAPD